LRNEQQVHPIKRQDRRTPQNIPAVTPTEKKDVAFEGAEWELRVRALRI